MREQHQQHVLWPRQPGPRPPNRWSCWTNCWSSRHSSCCCCRSHSHCWSGQPQVQQWLRWCWRSQLTQLERGRARAARARALVLALAALDLALGCSCGSLRDLVYNMYCIFIFIFILIYIYILYIMYIYTYIHIYKYMCDLGLCCSSPGHRCPGRLARGPDWEARTATAHRRCQQQL